MEHTKDNSDHLGKRVEVFWPEDEAFYSGKVTKKRKLGGGKGGVSKRNCSSRGKHKKSGCEYLIKYDDGDEEWIDLNSDDPNIKFVNEHSCSPQAKKEQKFSNEVRKVKINSKILVWWPLEKEFFPGKVTKILEGCDQPHHIKYDDGDEEWTNLNHRKFRMQHGKNEKKSSSNVTDQSTSSAASQLDGSGEKSTSPPGGKVASQSTSNATITLRRRNPLIYNQPPSQKELCRICHKNAKRPRATSCHHIFCKVCIKASSRRIGKKCPLCNISIKSTIEKDDGKWDSFRAIEALDINTFEVVYRFNTASSASLKIENIWPFRIIEACNSLTRKDRQYGGYYWQFKGFKYNTLKAEGGNSVEENNLETGSTNLQEHEPKVKKTIQIRKKKNGEVVKEFQTSKQAAQFINYQHNFDCCSSSICQWCNEESYELGFHWQYRI